jgi:hypothetical protein
MSTTVSPCNLNVSLVLNESAPQGSATNTILPALNLPFNLNSLVNTVFAAGTGTGKVNQFWTDVRTLNATTEDINIYAPGTGTDAMGNTLTIACVKFLFIANLDTVEAHTLTVGGKGTTAGWTSWLTANTYTLTIPGGSFVCVGDPLVGFTVGASTTNHLLTMTTSNNSNYMIAIVGSTS